MTRIASVLVVVLMLTACSDTDSAAPSTDESTPQTTTAAEAFDSFTTVEVPQLGFSIDQPLGWTAEVDEQNSILQVTAPSATDGFVPNFNVTVGELGDVPAVAYFEGEIPRLQATLPEVEILEVANLTVDGAMARGITLTSTENNTTIGISRLIILDDDNRAWELTFFAEASTLERLSRVVQTIFSSFEFLD